MPDTMKVQPFDTLLRRVVHEWEATGSIFGIHGSQFFRPRPGSPYVTQMFGSTLSAPIGPAAGPHTQLAQNIVCAWLSGGRFIELKTVQIMDELDIPRPCIDMADEGYNVEWSQELKLGASAAEYVKAWALIHVVHRLLGFEGRVPVGTVFNMSVGYNLAGIQSPAMVCFMERLADASEPIAGIRAVLRTQFPQFADVDIPVRLTNNVTLSTMHGCPPDEIERIARYLLEERGLHTLVKLNPTLLGQETVEHILHDELGFSELHIPAAAFEHDLKYERAVALIENLRAVASQRGLTFGVKLSNTLAMTNHRGVLPGAEMYMSGRALYPLTVNLFHKLAREFGGDLGVSYSGGADALNVVELLAAGARPVTAASDLLKPGGYARLLQYVANLEAEMARRGAASLDELAADRLGSLARAADDARHQARYKKAYASQSLPKVDSALSLFDCITAPCTAQCAVCQDVPGYLWLIARGEPDRALEVILGRNPLPGITGHVCTELCQARCTRSNYDQPLAIRALKRFAVARATARPGPVAARETSYRVAVIGSGPSGLAAAYFLALNGVAVTILEARAVAGGMPAIAPAFRLPPEVIKADVDRIAALGVQIELEKPVRRPPEALLSEGYDAVYVACGFQQDARLGIPGEDGRGVYSALALLEQAAGGVPPVLGTRVVVVGGGNTAMDAARTAQRLTGRPVTIAYRRTRAEMPAQPEEVDDLLAEGNELLELVSPLRVSLKDGRVAALRCVRNELGAADADGRRRPVPVPGSEFEIPADTIVVAVGQRPVPDLLVGSAIAVGRDGAVIVDARTGRTGPQHVYAGGDVVRGPATIVEACADGRRAAEAICRELGIAFEPPPGHPVALSADDVVAVKAARARRAAPSRPARLPPEQRLGFELVEQTLDPDAARLEAARCLQCSTLCDKCVEVCPNRANYSYQVVPARVALPRLVCRDGRAAVAGEDILSIAQERQIVHVDDFCNECGNCATFCVHQGRPYADKPRLFLTESDFRQESDNAFYVKGHTIWRREASREARLIRNESDMTYEYEDEALCVTFSPELSVCQVRLKEAFAGERALLAAGEMAVLLQGLTRSLPFLAGDETRE